MSAIRSDPSAVPFAPLPAGQAPVRASRSDFFKAALDAVQSAPVEQTLRAAAPQPTPAASEERPTRPGALLDIRV
ncbi:MAG: hypothetical protein Q8R45_11365 [Brevundimonas sp.]|uniref:hypothetical protein n=1 Tax=Brevundimonas sp. TaxID=1871086 RepID=UPI002733FEC2|nr:hypothetical protein [Brevundimonas sp.]MDP3657551.1 hypothetical protein [Brevundimonas sp.]MDZ4112228.1 hypothetical protein [Brevundimonas sp.]MDZ4319603.1 hypothetical protein [Phenylobacterium sp.]